MLHGKRIFMIEDDTANLAVTSIILQQAGATTFFDRWGIHTIDKLLKSLPVDIILLDLKLPHNISGYEVYDRLREVKDIAGIPIIAVTGADAALEVPKARSKGFDGYISKPIRHGLFPNQIAKILAGQSIWAGTSH